MSEEFGKVGFRVMKKYIKENKIDFKDFMFQVKMMSFDDELYEASFILKELRDNNVSVDFNFVEPGDIDYARFKLIQSRMGLFQVLYKEKDHIKQIMEKTNIIKNK